jgi:hypothetical protein
MLALTFYWKRLSRTYLKNTKTNLNNIPLWRAVCSEFQNPISQIERWGLLFVAAYN